MGRRTLGKDNSAAPDPSIEPDGVVEGVELAGLLERAVAGDQEAWRRIVGLYWRRVFALARSRLRDHGIAEEVTQSVFVTVATKLSQGQYAERGKFEPWLFRVVVNRIRDQVRALQRGATATDDEVLDARAGTVESRGEGTRASERAMEELRRALMMLGEADRQVVELRHHAGLSFAAMAELLDEPLGTLLARHHRALKKLRTMMAGVEASVMEDNS
ncbi:MAG: RNA polymerase sigma factor [Phycisphaerales bacterium]|nr:RNA polymerase sigma factor [Phycisphaerales bacterium]